MKITQVSEHVWSLKTWVLIPIHVWVVVEKDGVTLVDAGISTMASGILKFIDHLQSGPLKRIALTHGHPDHVGAIKKILKANPVPVYSHQIEIPFMEGDLPYPGRKKAAQSVDKGITQPFDADDQGQLQSIGGLTPYHTPGHAPGHVVFYHETDQICLAGDLFTSKKGKLHRPMPMFTSDMKKAVKSSEIIRKLKPLRLEVCHGNPIFQPANQLDEYIETTTKKYSILL